MRGRFSIQGAAPKAPTILAAGQVGGASVRRIQPESSGEAMRQFESEAISIARPFANSMRMPMRTPAASKLFTALMASTWTPGVSKRLRSYSIRVCQSAPVPTSWPSTWRVKKLSAVMRNSAPRTSASAGIVTARHKRHSWPSRVSWSQIQEPTANSGCSGVSGEDAAKARTGNSPVTIIASQRKTRGSRTGGISGIRGVFPRMRQQDSGGEGNDADRGRRSRAVPIYCPVTA